MRDGSDAIADWPILNALVNVAAGATWVSVHHGGGVGIGNSIHAGMVVRRRRHRRGGGAARARADDRPRHGRRPAPRRGLPRGGGRRARARAVDASTCAELRAPSVRDGAPRPRPRAARDAAGCGVRRCAAPRSATSTCSRTRIVLCRDGTIEAVGRMRDLGRSPATSRSSTAAGCARSRGSSTATRIRRSAATASRSSRCARPARATRSCTRRAAASSRPFARRARSARTALRARVARHAGWMLAPRHDDVGGQVGLRARPRHRARVAARDPRRRAARRRGSARTRCRPSSTTRDAYLDFALAEVLPDAARARDAADVFLERGAFDAAQARRYLEACRDAGLALRLHGDQFTESGAIPLAIELGARSVDHLEATGADGVAALASERRRSACCCRRARSSSTGRCRRPARSSTPAPRSRSRPTSTRAARSRRACRSSARSPARSCSSRRPRRSPR